MKRISILFIFVMLLIGFTESNSQTTPPTSSWALSATSGDYGSIFFTPPTYGGTFSINGRAMAAGDAIGVFYMDGTTRKCAGFMVWTGTNNTNNFSMNVWADDTLTTTVKEGFANGETLNYMMWDDVLDVEVPVISKVCNTTGIPTLNIPALGTCLTTFVGDMLFQFDSVTGQILAVPTLTTPVDLATGVSIAPTLTWSNVATATGYKVQVSLTNDFANLEEDLTVTTNTTDITGLAGSTVYFWRVRAVRGIEETAWSTVSSFTTETVQTGYTLSGTIKYAKTTPVAMNNMTIKLKDAQNAVVAQTTTDATGAYSFTGVADGSYTFEITTVKAWGGLVTADALRTRQHIGGIASAITPFNALRFKAADVVMNNSINTADALSMRRRIAAQTYTWTAPAYVFLPTSVTISGANAVVDIQSLCSGDVDGSFTPSND